MVLSADGSTLAAGIPDSNLAATEAGAVAVYTRPAGGWASSSTPGAILTFIDPYPNHLLGYGVALSADGSTLSAGAPGDRLGVRTGGGVELYSRLAGGWASTSDPTATFISVSDTIYSGNFGQAVALSADGSTLIAAPYSDTANIGVVAVFTRPAGGWASSDTPTTTLSLPNGTSGDRFGNSVALSVDGRTLAAGTPGREPGSVYVFINPRIIYLPLIVRQHGQLQPSTSTGTRNGIDPLATSGNQCMLDFAHTAFSLRQIVNNTLL